MNYISKAQFWNFIEAYKKRNIEALVLLVVFFCAYLIVNTAIVQYATETFPAYASGIEITKKESVKEITIKEHVFRLLTVEGGLTFDEAIEGMSIVNLESRWDLYAIGDNGKSHGLWQIHEPSHPQISRECKFDAYCSTRSAIEIYKKWGNTWNAWSTYKLIK